MGPRMGILKIPTPLHRCSEAACAYVRVRIYRIKIYLMILTERSEDLLVKIRCSYNSAALFGCKYVYKTPTHGLV